MGITKALGSLLPPSQVHSIFCACVETVTQRLTKWCLISRYLPIMQLSQRAVLLFMRHMDINTTMFFFIYNNHFYFRCQPFFRNFLLFCIVRVQRGCISCAKLGGTAEVLSFCPSKIRISYNNHFYFRCQPFFRNFLLFCSKAIPFHISFLPPRPCPSTKTIRSQADTCRLCSCLRGQYCYLCDTWTSIQSRSSASGVRGRHPVKRSHTCAKVSVRTCTANHSLVHDIEYPLKATACPPAPGQAAQSA